jgi:CheY-like chemotaxis protein
VRSAPGEGTVFDIYLPTAGHEPASAAEMPAAEEAIAGPLRPEPAVPATILLVEDEPAVSAFVCRVLRRGGHEVTAAATGEEAVRLLDEGLLVDLLITDVILPGMGGRAVATAARARHPGLEVLYISGYSEDAIVREGRVEPGLAFLEKPFTPAQLLAKVRGLTQR